VQEKTGNDPTTWREWAIVLAMVAVLAVSGWVVETVAEVLPG